ncbi:MAG: hexitol phosphatase HxpB [Bacteroidia bacterium]|nr:hexitol phosphatase HxpB [Bacteroidia bacterium]
MQGTLKALILDMDGVLVNSEPLWRRAMVKGFTAAGVNFTEEDCRKTTGRRINEVVEHWLNHHQLKHISAAELEAQIMQELFYLIESEGEPTPGIVAVLEFCKQRQLLVGLATSSSHDLMNRVLKKLNLQHYFQSTVSAEFLKYGKPHPEVFLLCAEELKTYPGESLVIEDSLNGVIAAKAAHMRVIAVPDTEHFELPGFAIANYKCNNMQDALKIISTLF